MRLRQAWRRTVDEDRVTGRGCRLPDLLDDVLDRLRQVDGVSAVTSSTTAGCIAIEHLFSGHVVSCPVGTVRTRSRHGFDA
jgi:hypothetical protein